MCMITIAKYKRFICKISFFSSHHFVMMIHSTQKSLQVTDHLRHGNDVFRLLRLTVCALVFRHRHEHTLLAGICRNSSQAVANSSLIAAWKRPFCRLIYTFSNDKEVLQHVQSAERISWRVFTGEDIFLTGTESAIVTLGQSLRHAVQVEFKSYMTHNTRLAVTENRGGWEDNPLNTTDEGESAIFIIVTWGKA